jgi:copper(I)-binding protein
MPRSGGKPMTYSDFETRLLLALAATAADGSQPSAFVVAATVAPQVNAQWVRDAVLSFEQRGYFHRVVRPMYVSAIFMTITAEGRKAAEKLSAP